MGLVADMPPRGDTGLDGDDDTAIWVPVTLHLPLGLTKSFTIDHCAPLALLVGPFSIILLAQTANTVLVPVLPFLVKDVGGAAVAYGMLQSTLWSSQTVLAPVLGWLSDRLGRRPVILLSLLFSAAGNALLAMAESVTMMMVARVISGLGFQIALFLAYFADSAPKQERTGRFGLIGVVTSASLFAGPFFGGLVAHSLGRRAGAWISAALCVAAALICLAWRPDEKAVDQSQLRRSSSYQKQMAGDLQGLAAHRKTHKVVNGVRMVKIDLTESTPADEDAPGEEGAGTVPAAASAGSTNPRSSCSTLGPCRFARKVWMFGRWLSTHGLYPLLSLNFFFRFAFAAYKSVFAFFCMGVLSYGEKEVGYLLSAMGLGGMFVQGVLVRIVVGRLGEEKTLFVAMACTSGGFVLLSCATSLHLLLPALTLIAIGYGLAVPCLTFLFSNVPVEQGIMQGIAGAIDRFGQAFGPVVGGSLLAMLGEARLMRVTGVALAIVALLCLAAIGEGWLHWMREVFCHPAAGYRQVGQLDVIEEEDEAELAELGTPTKGDADDDADDAGGKFARAAPTEPCKPSADAATTLANGHHQHAHNGGGDGAASTISPKVCQPPDVAAPGRA